MIENEHYWAELAAEDENAHRLQVVAGIPVEYLERFAHFYWTSQDIDYNVYGGSEH